MSAGPAKDESRETAVRSEMPVSVWTASGCRQGSRHYDRHDSRMMRPLAICAIFKNEAPYLREWIEFHRLVGVSHFYLYRNGSTDDWEPVLRPYIGDGIATIVD